MSTCMPAGRRNLQGQLVGGLAAFVLGLSALVTSVTDPESTFGRARPDFKGPSVAASLPDASTGLFSTMAKDHAAAARVRRGLRVPGEAQGANGPIAPAPTPTGWSSAGDELIPGPAVPIEHGDLRAALLEMSAARRTGRWTSIGLSDTIFLGGQKLFEATGRRDAAR